MTAIQWCDEVWNPTVGCSRVSSGCDNCYAMRVAHRGMAPAHKGLTKLRGKDAARPGVDWNGTVREVPEALGKPLRWKKPRRVFVNSMSDLFHPGVSFEFVATVFGVMAACPQHTFLVLTKRPERARGFFRWYEGDSGAGCHPEAAIRSAQDDGVFRWDPFEDLPDAWPLPNVHLGVSVEDQATADERIPVLLGTPAAVRWVSLEPLLGPVDLSKWLGGHRSYDGSRESVLGVRGNRRVQSGCGRGDLENAAPNRRQHEGDAPLLEGHPHPTGGDVDIGRVSNGDVFGRGQATQGFRASCGLDGHEPVGHPTGPAGQPQERQAGGHEAREPRDVHAVRERDSCDKSARPAGVAFGGREEPSGHAYGRAGPKDSGARRKNGAVADREALQHEAADRLEHPPAQELETPTLAWIVVGGESGPGARPFDVAWARSTIEQGKAAGVPVFVKQLGADFQDAENGIGGAATRTPDTYGPLHRRLRDRKGGDMSEWPEDLRVREYPGVRP